MSKAYLIRGQGIGVVHDKVYLIPPTDVQMRAVLFEELKRHGLVVNRDEDGNVSFATRERWVQTQVTELIDGVPLDETPEEPVRLSGTLNQEQINEILAELQKAPPGTMAAAAPMMAVTGTGRIINPDEKEKMSIGADDVGTISSSDFIDPSTK